MSPEDIIGWSQAVRTAGADAFQINNWIPGRTPRRDFEREAALRAFLAQWGSGRDTRSGGCSPSEL